MQTQSVDPSVSRTPLPLDADDLATVCVLCSHNCGLRVDVRGGEIVDGARATRRIPITEGYVCNKAFSIAALRRARATHPGIRCVAGPTAPSSASPGTRRSREIAAKLRDDPRRHSPRAIALVGIGGQGNHMDAPYGVGVPARARLAALVQRLRAGEDAAQSPRPVDVRRVAGGVPPSRHRAQRASCWCSARTRRSPTAATTPPTRFKRFARRPGTHAGRRRPARDRDDARRATATCACGRAPTSTCCSRWPP